MCSIIRFICQRKLIVEINSKLLSRVSLPFIDDGFNGRDYPFITLAAQYKPRQKKLVNRHLPTHFTHFLELPIRISRVPIHMVDNGTSVYYCDWHTSGMKGDDDRIVGKMESPAEDTQENLGIHTNSLKDMLRQFQCSSVASIAFYWPCARYARYASYTHCIDIIVMQSLVI